MYSPENYGQYPVINHNENEYEKAYIYIIGEGDGTPLQYSCLENPVDGEAW